MITQFQEYNTSKEANFTEQQKIVQEYLGTYERKILILENYWNLDIFNNQSVKPFYENIGNLICDDVKVAHRYIDSKEGLTYYIHYPTGLIWANTEIYGVSTFIFETHGSIDTNGLELPLNKASKQETIDNFNGFGDFPNILYFGGCGIFNGEDGTKFGMDLLESSGSRAIFGFCSKQLSFATSTLVGLLFLSTFYLYHESDPFDHLPEIYESVLRNFPVAASANVGFTMFYDE